MKTKIEKMKKFMMCIIMVINLNIYAQNPSVNEGKKEIVAVLNIDTKGLNYDSVLMGNMVRLELEKTNVYEVLDKYEMSDVIERKKIDVSACYGKTCLVELAKTMKVDKILTGSVELFGDKIIITLRLIDANTNSVPKTNVTEYLNIQSAIKKMVEISVKNLLNIENDPNVTNLLVNYDDPIINTRTQLKLNGPRMGAAYITGDMGERLQDPIEEGGFDGYPIMSQFGYQYETQYLSAGNFQALVEFLFIVSGMEQQMFVPSFTFMNGFRNSKNGWEIAFGPTISLKRKARGYFDDKGIWHLKSDWMLKDDLGNDIENPYPIIERIDNRGLAQLSSGWVWAIGKTFKSGYLNIPVNVYVSPSKKGCYAGFSVGFNISKKHKIK